MKHASNVAAPYHPLARTPLLATLPDPAPLPRAARYAFTPVLFDKAAAAYYLGVCPRVLDDLVRDGLVRSLHRGRSLRFHRDDLDAYAASLKQPA